MEIIAYQEWEEYDGEWYSTGWADSLDDLIGSDYFMVEVLETDKYGHPIKAIFRPITSSSH